MLKSAASISPTTVMAAKTPIFLCVRSPSPVLDKILTFYFVLTLHHSLSHDGVSSNRPRSRKYVLR